MRINCIIIDDEPLARESTADNIALLPELNLIESFDNAKAALSFLNSHDIDLIFCDIHMPGISGVEFKKIMNEKGNKTKLIFITAHREFAIESFEVKAFDYILKPVSPERFIQSVHYFIEQFNEQTHNQNDSDHFFVKVDGKYQKLFFDNILFIEGLKDFVFIYTPTEKLITLISLKSVEENLLGKSFLRVHRSFIVNTSKIDSIEGTQLYIGNHIIPIGKTLKEETFNKLLGKNIWKRQL